jgi:two-component system, OmpR family, catabolic regulation response regulator CreB
MPPLILLIEDEPAIADTLVYALGTEGFRVEHCLLGRAGMERLRAGGVALAILDVGLPDANGFDLCRELRGFSDVPVIFLTARGDEIDRVVGLEIGGDDYVVKPFSPRELTARVRSVLRRRGAPAAVEAVPAPTPAQWVQDAAGQRVIYHGVALELTRYEYLLLAALLEGPGRIYSRSQLMERAWVAPDHSLERTVDTHIKTLRAKLRAVAPDEEPILTHRGLGYSLDARLAVRTSAR